MAKYYNTIRANPLVQIGAMKSKYPQFKSKRVGDKVVFTGELQCRRKDRQLRGRGIRAY